MKPISSRRRAGPFPLLALLLPLLCVGPAPAQETAETIPPALQAAVDAYLAEGDDTLADEQLKALVVQAAGKERALLLAVKAASAPLPRTFPWSVPYRGQLLVATVTVPDGHDRSGARLPVILDISGGGNLARLGLRDVITVTVSGYTPPQFSDEGRDGFRKILNATAHRAHGDFDRMWMTGYSWAGHACYDNALHRPGTARGLIPTGGGPRRVHFRLLPNLEHMTVAAFCGAKDDPELVWNLRELERICPTLGIDYALTLDPDAGHNPALLALDKAGARLLDVPARDAILPRKGTLVADGPLVENLFLRIDTVDDRRIAVPRAVPVSSTLSEDGKRRATLAAMEKKVATVSWTLTDVRDVRRLALKASAAKTATVLLRDPAWTVGQAFEIRVRGRKVSDGAIAIDPKVLLPEARRTGERLRPALMAISVNL
jgi:hypothetical protein